MRWHHWVIVGLGVWLLASPWLLGFAELNLVVWNNLLVGLLMIVFALWNFTPPQS